MQAAVLNRAYQSDNQVYATPASPPVTPELDLIASRMNTNNAELGERILHLRSIADRLIGSTPQETTKSAAPWLGTVSGITGHINSEAAATYELICALAVEIQRLSVL